MTDSRTGRRDGAPAETRGAGRSAALEGIAAALDLTATTCDLMAEADEGPTRARMEALAHALRSYSRAIRDA